jgi:hypothetical protein
VETPCEQPQQITAASSTAAGSMRLSLPRAIQLRRMVSGIVLQRSNIVA